MTSLRGLKTILTFFLVFPPILVFGANCNSNGNGNWISSGTWNCGNPPNAGDEIVIEANTVVSINSNLTYTGDPMHVVVYGTWSFVGSGSKISLSCGSSVVIGFGGQVLGNGTGSSQTIKICSTTYWSANEGEVTGPMGWPDGVLPVELISFNGKAQDRAVILDWITGSEQNSSHFEVMASQDSENWEMVASVEAAGQSSALQQYNVSLQVPVADQWYFKLVQIDLDGSVEQLGIIVLDIQEDLSPQLNCARSLESDLVTAQWMGGEFASAAVVDMRGSMITPAVHFRGSRSIEIDLSTLNSGFHILSVWDSLGARRNCKLLVR